VLAQPADEIEDVRVAPHPLREAFEVGERLARVAIRAVRRDALTDVKDLLKEKMITEDEERKAEIETQKITDRFIAQIDALLKDKEAEIMEV